MATTSPDDIWTPDAGDDYALTADLAAMADTIQDAISLLRAGLSYISGPDAVRQGIPSGSLFEGLHFWTTDTKIEWIYTGGTWTSFTTVAPTLDQDNWAATGGYTPTIYVDGVWRELYGAMTRNAGGALTGLLRIPAGHRPSVNWFIGAGVSSSGAAYELRINPATGILDIPYGGGSTTGVYPLSGRWKVG